MNQGGSNSQIPLFGFAASLLGGDLHKLNSCIKLSNHGLGTTGSLQCNYVKWCGLACD